MKRADRHVAITDGRDPDGNMIELHEAASGEHCIALLHHRLRSENMNSIAPQVPPLLVGEAVDLPLRGELRYGLELTRLVCDPAFLHPGCQTDAPPVLLVPGFM